MGQLATSTVIVTCAGCFRAAVSIQPHHRPALGESHPDRRGWPTTLL